MPEENFRSGQEDFGLLARAAEGDEAAFTLLVQKHSGPLLNFLRRYTKDQGASEDIAQEAFLRLYKAAGGLKPGGAKLSTILYKIAYNLAVDQARRDKSRAARAPTHSLDADAAAAGAQPASDRRENPDAIYEAAQRDKEIALCLEELPQAQTAAIVLKVYEGRSYAEIAEIMHLSVPAVESLLFRARQSLAKAIAGKS